MKVMARRRKYNKNHLKLILWILVLVVFLIVCVIFFHRRAEEVKPSGSTASSSTNHSSQGTFNKNLYSVNFSSSLWVVVNKGRVLPSSYVPAGLVVPNVSLRLISSSSEMHLRSDAAAALEKLFNGASKSGLHLMLSSGYRSYSEQAGLYDSYVSSSGQTAADTFSARSGHSEHQTGLAADIEPASRKCEVDTCFADTPEGKWLAANAFKYGFIIRYPADKTKVTGYEYEPWHVRYVSTSLSGEMHKTGIETLEEFFDLPSYTSYPATSYQLR